MSLHGRKSRLERSARDGLHDDAPRDPGGSNRGEPRGSSSGVKSCGAAVFLQRASALELVVCCRVRGSLVGAGGYLMADSLDQQVAVGFVNTVITITKRKDACGARCYTEGCQQGSEGCEKIEALKEHHMTVLFARHWKLAILWALSLVAVSVISTEAQRPGFQLLTVQPTVVSGNDVGFRIERTQDGVPVGRVVVRIEGRWVDTFAPESR
jgi:hypothetical protein